MPLNKACVYDMISTYLSDSLSLFLEQFILDTIRGGNWNA
jgi:hypothetical protein